MDEEQKSQAWAARIKVPSQQLERRERPSVRCVTAVALDCPVREVGM